MSAHFLIAARFAPFHLPPQGPSIPLSFPYDGPARSALATLRALTSLTGAGSLHSPLSLCLPVRGRYAVLVTLATLRSPSRGPLDE